MPCAEFLPYGKRRVEKFNAISRETWRIEADTVNDALPDLQRNNKLCAYAKPFPTKWHPRLQRQNVEYRTKNHFKDTKVVNTSTTDLQVVI